jgi:hypothetical protein
MAGLLGKLAARAMGVPSPVQPVIAPWHAATPDVTSAREPLASPPASVSPGQSMVPLGAAIPSWPTRANSEGSGVGAARPERASPPANRAIDITLPSPATGDRDQGQVFPPRENVTTLQSVVSDASQPPSVLARGTQEVSERAQRLPDAPAADTRRDQSLDASQRGSGANPSPFDAPERWSQGEQRRAGAAQEAPVIRVTIGRIEVRAVEQQVSPSPRRAATAQPSSLDAYLRARDRRR